MDDIDEWEEDFFLDSSEEDSDESPFDLYSQYNYEEVSHFMTNYDIKDLWKDCLTPTLSDGFLVIFHLLMSCLLFRFTCSLEFFPTSVIHLTSGLCGLYCLYHLYGSLCVYICILAAIGYFSILFVHKFVKKYRGLTCAIICFTFLIACEIFIVEPTAWHRIRGSQMVLGMKLMSLAFDIDQEVHIFPSVIECFGYFFSVGNVIFGPWLSFGTYLRVLNNYEKSFQWGLKITKSFILGFAFLTMSTCWTSWLFQFTSWKWIAAYRDALSFRSSHYFVSYISESLMISSGISDSSEEWSFTVVKPYNIELPRSLVEVVTCWNLPMHFWLKKYVFLSAKPLGKFVPIILTFAASSLLHGLNFQLAAVLLSLGFYTYIEGALRKKLAMIFSMCILAKRCKPDCDHEHKNKSVYTIVINLCFGLLAMFHLAYLGVMFDTSSENQEKGYSMAHTLKTWSNLGYSSHWVAFFTYFFYAVVA